MTIFLMRLISEYANNSVWSVSCFDYHSNDYVLLPTSVKLHVLSDIKVIQHGCKSNDTK